MLKTLCYLLLLFPQVACSQGLERFILNVSRVDSVLMVNTVTKKESKIPFYNKNANGICFATATPDLIQLKFYCACCEGLISFRVMKVISDNRLLKSPWLTIKPNESTPLMGCPQNVPTPPSTFYFNIFGGSESRTYTDNRCGGMGGSKNQYRVFYQSDYTTFWEIDSFQIGFMNDKKIEDFYIYGKRSGLLFHCNNQDSLQIILNPQKIHVDSLPGIMKVQNEGQIGVQLTADSVFWYTADFGALVGRLSHDFNTEELYQVGVRFKGAPPPPKGDHIFHFRFFTSEEKGLLLKWISN